MSRTILAAIGLIALAACGGGDKKAPPSRPKAPAPSTQRVASRSKSATKGSQKPKSSQKKKKASARPDTTTRRNPLTN